MSEVKVGDFIKVIKVDRYDKQRNIDVGYVLQVTEVFDNGCAEVFDPASAALWRIFPSQFKKVEPPRHLRGS